MGLGLQSAFGGDAVSQAIADILSRQRQQQLLQISQEGNTRENERLKIAQSAEARASEDDKFSHVIKTLGAIDGTPDAYDDAGAQAAPAATPAATPMATGTAPGPALLGGLSPIAKMNAALDAPDPTPQALGTLTPVDPAAAPSAGAAPPVAAAPRKGRSLTLPGGIVLHARTPEDIASTEDTKAMNTIEHLTPGSSLATGRRGILTTAPGPAAKEPAVTGAELDKEFQDLVAKRDLAKRGLGPKLTPQEEADLAASETRRTLVTNTNFDNRKPYMDATQITQSYQRADNKIAGYFKEINDQALRLQKLKVTLNQQGNLADSLLAPEIVVAMAGGQGSGVRINEAEIDRVLGGQNRWDNLKRELKKWDASGQPHGTFLVDDKMRAQMRDVIRYIDQKNQTALRGLDKLGDSLLDANSGPDFLDRHRAIVKQARDMMQHRDDDAEVKLFSHNIEGRIANALHAGASREQAVNFLIKSASSGTGGLTPDEIAELKQFAGDRSKGGG